MQFVSQDFRPFQRGARASENCTHYAQLGPSQMCIGPVVTQALLMDHKLAIILP